MACHAPDVIAVPPAEWPEAEPGTSRDMSRHGASSAQWIAARTGMRERLASRL